MLRKSRRRPIIVILTGGLLATLLVTGLREIGAIEFLELAAYDWFIRISPKKSVETPWITIIEVSEQDIQNMGSWPLSDGTIAEAIEIILNADPRAVGLDIYRDIPVPPGSEYLNKVFLENKQLIGIMTVGEEGIRPLKVIRGTDQAAFGDIVVDPGGIARRGLLFLDDGQTAYTSFSLRLASIYLAAEGVHLQPDPQNPSFLRLGKTTIEPLEEDFGGYQNIDARGYQYLLDFADAAVAFRSYSILSLLAHKVPPEAMADRIVLVGVKSQSVRDYFFTPLSEGFTEYQHLAGIDLHALMTSQLLRIALENTPPIHAPTESHKLIWLLIWGFLGSTLVLRIRSAREFFLLIVGGLLVLFCLAYLAFLASWWIPLVPPACAFLMAGGGVTAYLTGQEKKERAALMQIFSKHVSAEVATMIWEQRDQFLSDGRLKPQNMIATVFFSDLKDFATVSEKMPPQELINWLNIYMEAMAGLIMKFGGVIDSYAGDGIKADFGVPIPRQNPEEIKRDALNAVSCALAMEHEMARLNLELGDKELLGMGIRIGIYTGPVVSGLLGSSKRLKYTTIGDTVNIASRLESFDKELDRHSLCRILIGDTTLEHIQGQFDTKQIGEVTLKGKEQTIIIHQVLGSAHSRSTQLQEVNHAIPK